MNKYEVTVDWNYRSYDRAVIVVEAENQDEAATKALELVELHDEWDSGDILDGEFEVMGVIAIGGNVVMLGSV